MPQLPWVFPVPVTTASFEAPSTRWSPFNIRTDLGAIGAWAFSTYQSESVAWWDGQSEPDDASRGRLGSGRAAVYRGFHVKGIGRTPAAANWNDARDHYHGSGQMSPSSALRELLISRALTQRGLGHAIVPCEAILLAPIDPRDQPDHAATLAARARAGKQDSIATAAMLALSLKRADFARFSNFAFALERFEREVAWTGRLMLEFERFLAPPNERRDPQGTPEAIAEAMERAFERVFQNMLDFAAQGVCWIHLLNNYTLDGRWVDIETPLFTGRPLVGKILVGGPRGEPQIAGFECYEMVRRWRRALRWLDVKLADLAEPGLIDHAAGSAFLLAVRSAFQRRFRKSLLRDDRAVRYRAEAFLADRLGLDGEHDRQRFRLLSRYAFDTSVRCVNEPPPDLGWRTLPEQPALPSPGGAILAAAPFAPMDLAPDARQFAADLARLEALTTPREVFSGLAVKAARRK